MRLVSLKQGRDFNYDTTNIFSFSVKENEGYGEEIYVLRAHEGISGKDMQIAKSFNKSEIESKMKEIIAAYESNNTKVFYVDQKGLHSLKTELIFIKMLFEKHSKKGCFSHITIDFFLKVCYNKYIERKGDESEK